MKICSFDIGEKNFAYCIALSQSQTVVVDSVHHHDIVYKKHQTVPESCVKISQILEEDPQVQQCDVVLIEQQTHANLRAVQLAQHVWSWFYAKFGKKPIFIAPRLKFTHFAESRKLNYYQRKKWSIQKILQILTTNDPSDPEETKIITGTDVITHIQTLKKKDDVADAILQLFAWLKV
jgi:hypothetical protein